MTDIALEQNLPFTGAKEYKDSRAKGKLPDTELKERLREGSPHGVLELLAQEPDEDVATSVDVKRKTVIETVHRAGFRKDGPEQNSIRNLEETLLEIGAGGVEVDVALTKDGVPVITHDNVVNMTFEEFKAKFLDHMSLEGLVKWWKANEQQLQGKKLWFDMKVDDPRSVVRDLHAGKITEKVNKMLGKEKLPTGDPKEVDAFNMLKLIGDLGENAFISSKDPGQIAKFLIARRILGTDTKISLAVPDPWDPNVSVQFAAQLADKVGLWDVAQTGSVRNQQILDNLRPDMLNFYWPENIAKDIKAEKPEYRHGEFFTKDDPTRPTHAETYSKIPGLAWHQEQRLQDFVDLAHEYGFQVMAGSAAGEINEKMIEEWGVDGVMPNNPSIIPDALREAREANATEGDADVQRLSEEDQYSNEFVLQEGNLQDELTDSFYDPADRDIQREEYLRLAARVRSTNIFRQQIGI